MATQARRRWARRRKSIPAIAKNFSMATLRKVCCFPIPARGKDERAAGRNDGRVVYAEGTAWIVAPVLTLCLRDRDAL
jgi:hypothetical protein